MHGKPPLNVNGVRFVPTYVTPSQLEDGDHDAHRAAWEDAPRPTPAAMKWAGFVLLGLIVALCAALFFAALCGTPAHGQTLPTLPPATRPTTPVRFGVYSQKLENLPKLRALGFDFYLYSELQGGRVDQRTYRRTAAAAGWDYFDTYLDDDDVKDPHLLGWLPRNHDEWNRRKPDLAPILAEIDRLKALNARAGTDKLILVNADGMAVTTALWEKPPYNGVKNGERDVLTRATGWSMDWYPVVNTPADTPEQIARRPMHLPAQAMWRMQTWGAAWGVKPALRLAILEANKGFNSPLRVTPAQMVEQLEYVLGDRPFPVPDGQARPLPVQFRTADAVVYWTANGQNGPGFDWLTSSPEQLDTMRTLIARYAAKPIDRELAAARAQVVELKADRDAKAALLQRVRDLLAATQPATTQTTEGGK